MWHERTMDVDLSSDEEIIDERRNKTKTEKSKQIPSGNGNKQPKQLWLLYSLKWDGLYEISTFIVSFGTICVKIF